MLKPGRISTTLPASVIRLLKRTAEYQGRSMSGIAAYAIETYLKEQIPAAKRTNVHS